MSDIPGHFLNAESTIRNVSYDDCNDEYMCDSQMKIYDFDMIKDWYAGNLNNSETGNNIKSNDALYCDGNRFTFIEFKNGKIDRSTRIGLRIKALDSVIILCDSKTEASKLVPNFVGNASYTRENVDYILVYNESKNPHSSSGKGIIEYNLNRKANNPRFSLAYLKGYLFNRVLTYTEEEFDRLFVSVHNK